MKKLYSEMQYREYLKLMDKMANIDDFIVGAQIHIEIEDWLAENNISQMAQQQMDERMEEEFENEIGNTAKEGKLIDFPKK